MLFAGCSYTWGQSLHYYGGFSDDVHKKDGFFYENELRPHHYQYNVDNRFATKVADYFGRKAIVAARNGNSNPLMVDWIYRKLKQHPTIDCIVVQSTSFHRGFPKRNEKEQIEDFNNLIDYCDSHSILIKFLHMDLGGGDYLLNKEFKLSKKIIERTILFDDKLDWFHTLIPNMGKYDYRTVASDFPEVSDTHFNLKGHDYVSKNIIQSLLKSNYSIIKKIEIPKLLDNIFFKKSDFDELYQYYNTNFSNNPKRQYLLYKNISESCAYDVDISDNNLINSFIDKIKKYNPIRCWMLVYSPYASTGFHSDLSDDFYRYVFEIQSSNNSKFVYVNYDEFKSIDNFEDKILFIGSAIHSFENKSTTDTRIAIVFDTTIPIHKRENLN